MFIAHAPAGYLLSRALARSAPNRRGLVLTGVACSLLPDTDLLWFYLVDNRQTLHREYVFHWPLFWLAICGALALLARVTQRRRALPYLAVAAACLLLHMLLDSVTAHVHWAAPLADLPLRMVEVPARYDGWVWNFLLHWTFAIELAICAVAAVVLWLSLRSRGARAATAPR